MYNIQCKIYNVQYTMYNIQCTIYNVQYKMYNIQCTIYNVQYTMYNIKCNIEAHEDAQKMWHTYILNTSIHHSLR